MYFMRGRKWHHNYCLNRLKVSGFEMHIKLKLATKIKKKFGAIHGVRQKANRTFVKRNSCSNVAEEN